MRKRLVVLAFLMALLFFKGYGQAAFSTKNSIKIGFDLAYNEVPSALVSYERLLSNHFSFQAGLWGSIGLRGNSTTRKTYSYRLVAGLKYYLQNQPQNAMSGFYLMPLVRRTASRSTCDGFPKPCYEGQRLEFGLGLGYQHLIWRKFQMDAIVAPCLLKREIRQAYDSNGFLDSQYERTQSPSLYLSISIGYLFKKNKH